jgi:Cytochrome c552
VETIQGRTVALRNRAIDALIALIADIKAAKAAGATGPPVTAALEFQRHGQFHVDFVESENSNGFDAPQEAAAHPGRGHRLPAARTVGVAARARVPNEIPRAVTRARSLRGSFRTTFTFERKHGNCSRWRLMPCIPNRTHRH